MGLWLYQQLRGKNIMAWLTRSLVGSIMYIIVIAVLLSLFSMKHIHYIRLTINK
jgi:hypothetical protein